MFPKEKSPGNLSAGSGYTMTWKLLSVNCRISAWSEADEIKKVSSEIKKLSSKLTSQQMVEKYHRKLP